MLRAAWYSGRAPANELARRGFVVLVHDTFSWRSRRFDLSQPTPRLAGMLEAYAALWRERHLTPSADEQFDLASSIHEDTLAKAAGALGQKLAGAVLTDDLVALDVLAATKGVDPIDCRRSDSPAAAAAACWWPHSTTVSLRAS